MLRGPSGSGKSDLALRLMDEGAVLVSDDQTCLHLTPSGLLACAPEPIAGLMEIRGIGLVPVPHHDHVALELVVDLTAYDRIERLPDFQQTEYLGVKIPLLRLDAFAASTPAKIRFYLRGEV